MSMKRVLVPSRSISDWPCAVGGDALEGEARAAQLLAHDWQAADGFPPAIQAMLASSGVQALETAELLFAVPGWEVMLPGGGEAHVSDLLALATCEVDETAALLVILVEAYGEASSGETYAYREAACWPGEERRLAATLDLLDLCHAPPELLDEIPCGLLEHAAAAAITARDFTAGHALVLAHGYDAPPAAGVATVRLAGLLAGEAQLDATQTSGGHVLGPALVGDTAISLVWIDDHS